MKYVVITSLALAATALVGIFNVSYRTETIADDISRLKREISAAQSKQKILHAEWAYLNDPERLKSLLAQVSGSSGSSGWNGENFSEAHFKQATSGQFTTVAGFIYELENPPAVQDPSKKNMRARQKQEAPVVIASKTTSQVETRTQAAAVPSRDVRERSSLPAGMESVEMLLATFRNNQN